MGNVDHDGIFTSSGEICGHECKVKYEVVEFETVSSVYDETHG